MKRDIMIILAVLAIGWISGYVSAVFMRPSRIDIAENLAESLISTHDGIKAEVYSDPGNGPTVYVKTGQGRNDGGWIAKIEIGYEGEYLASFWDEKQDFFAYHFGRASTREAIDQQIKAGRTRKGNQNQSALAKPMISDPGWENVANTE